MSYQPPGTYDNAYASTNVLGHSVELLRRHRTAGPADALHLDVGCGFGHIAEPIAAELGRTYVGVDFDELGLASLRARGFEAHHLVLSGDEATYEALKTIIAGRRLASITMIDTMEHLADGDAVLRAIGRIAAEASALFVLSVPNIAHDDVGFKLALGRFDYTPAGLLDRTHVRLFSADLVDRVLRSSGFYEFDRYDVVMAESDQCFPQTHPALARGTQLHAYLRELRANSNPYAHVNQFVRICAPAAPAQVLTHVEPANDATRPFLSVVVRTQGKRPHTLTEVLTALAGQSDDDFEVLVVGHRLTVERQLIVERIIADCPTWLREKCTLLRVDDGNRTRPLNEGFGAAQGRYIAIMDDDDLPFGHWVETFKTLAEQSPGRLLRAACVRQFVDTVTIQGKPGLRAVDKLDRTFPSDFDYVAHLRMNFTPNHCLAFPRGVFHDLGMRFDETLTTTEDWDYIMRVASVVGTVSSPEITSIYRWWQSSESSRTLHGQDEWQGNYRRILQKMDDRPMLMPRGTTARIRELLDQRDAAAAGQPAPIHAVDAQAAGLAVQQVLAGALAAEAERVHRLREVVLILESTSWRITRPFRTVAQILGRPRVNYDRIWNCGAAELTEIAVSLRRSTSWRLAQPLRMLRTMVSKPKTAPSSP